MGVGTILCNSSQKSYYDNEYDIFFNIEQKTNSTYTKKEESNIDFEKEQQRIIKSNADWKKKRQSENCLGCLILLILGTLLALLIVQV